MAEMILNKKAKCGGCFALEYEKCTFSCALGVPIKQSRKNKKSYAPIPKKECFKPTTEARYKEVLKAQKKKKK